MPSGALEMVRDASAAGFDAVKFQYWIVDELLAAEVPNAAYQGDGDQRDLLAGLALTLDELAALRAECRDSASTSCAPPTACRPTPTC